HVDCCVGLAAGALPHQPDRVVLDRAGRARALLYIGMTAPLPYLGYTYIAGRDLDFLLIPTLIVTIGCLGGAAMTLLTRRSPQSGK
ncbi:MAG TPA: hypothetical protein VFG76_10550, partial [Candidatus Polarisedimenticolia bacterium]|nr:hypothetical protein [Candidatus Polarisedimenticolia bacterium]